MKKHFKRQALWRTIWRFLKELKIELPCDPATPLLGIHPEKNIIQKDPCSPMFTAAFFTIAKAWKQAKCPLDFPGGSNGKESACNVGDPRLIPGSGRSSGEGNGNPSVH